MGHLGIQNSLCGSVAISHTACSYSLSVRPSVNILHRKHDNLKDIELTFTKLGTYIPLGKILDEFDNGDLDLLFKVTTPYILRTWAP